MNIGMLVQVCLRIREDIDDLVQRRAFLDFSFFFFQSRVIFGSKIIV